MDWIPSAREDLVSYVVALRLRWSPDNARGRLVNQDEQGGVVSDGMLQTDRRVPFRWAAFGIDAALVLSACSNADTARWTEEVKSWDGHIFQLEGYAEKDKSGWPLSHRGTTRFIEYYHPASGAYWKQEFGHHPVVLDFYEDKPVVILEANSDSGCIQHGFPKTGLVAFRWGTSGWEPISFDALPVDKMSFNLLRGIFDRNDVTKDARGFVSVAEKVYRDKSNFPLPQVIAEGGQRCASVKVQMENGRKSNIPPAPTLAGIHGLPHRFQR